MQKFPPFHRWKLPPSEEIEFAVTKAKDRIGSYIWNGKVHRITISAEFVGHYDTLVRTMAHEMIHLSQESSGDSNGAQHNADFRRRAALVAKYHGFDPKEL